MYVHEGKRRFFVTVREVRDDNALGESESFSVYDSEIRMNRRQLIDCIVEAINKSGEKKPRN